jgi:hypothetical protein
MINERCQEVVFRTGLVQVMKFDAHMDISFLIIHKNRIRYPFGQGNWVDEANIK